MRILQKESYSIPDKEFICCDLLKDHFKNAECYSHGPSCPDLAVKYEAKTRTFTLVAENAEYTCYYCPWCGSKFPKSLSEEYWEILDKEFSEKYPNIPEEYKTDTWWKLKYAISSNNS